MSAERASAWDQWWHSEQPVAFTQAEVDELRGLLTDALRRLVTVPRGQRHPADPALQRELSLTAEGLLERQRDARLGELDRRARQLERAARRTRDRQRRTDRRLARLAQRHRDAHQGGGDGRAR